MLKINAFSGEVPKVHPRLLGDGYAQTARNTRLENGALVPIRKSRLETEVSATAVTIYRHEGTWLEWDHVVNAVPGPVATKRLYTTGGEYPKMLAEDDVWYKLALYPPSGRLTTSLTADNELLTVDGREIRLVSGVKGTTTHGWKYIVTQGDSAGSVVVTVSYSGGASAGQVAQLLNGLKYRNASDPVNEGIRTVSLSSIVPVDGDEIELECLDSFVDVGPTGDATTHCTPDDYGSAYATLTIGEGQVDAPSWVELHIGNIKFSDTINAITVGGVDLIDSPVPCSVYESVNDQYIKNYDGLADAINSYSSGFTAEVRNVDAVKRVRIHAPDASGSSHDGDDLLVAWASLSGFGIEGTFGGGATGSTLSSVTVDGVELLTSDIDYADFSSPSAIAAEVAEQINASSTTPDYTAEVDGAVVTIYSDDSLLEATGRDVAVVSGIAIDISGPMAGDTAAAVKLVYLDPDFSSGDPAVALFSGAVVSGSISKLRLTVASLANGAVDSDLSSTILYSYTWVTRFDEESEPAELSEDLLWSPGNIVKLTGFAAPQADRGIDRVRIYRSQTSALGETSLYFVAELELADLGSSWIDDPDENEIQEVCPSIDYNPPLDGLRGLVALPNGMMAAFHGRDLYFSEPWRPHAWPEKYMLSTNVDIVGLGAFGSSVAVLTEGTPYVVQGTAPDAMTMERLEVDLPCTSYRAIVDMGYLVAYPSHDGLVTISSSGAQLVSQNLFTREQWQALYPDALLASRHAGRYVLSYYTGSSEEARDVILIDLSGAQPFVIRGTANMRSQYYEAPTGQLFYVTPADPPTSNDVLEWDCLTEDREVQTWRSKQFVLPAHTNFGALLIEAEPVGDETAAVAVFADGVLKATVTKLNEPARLPSGFLARQWELEVTGTVPVTGLTLAMSPAEIAGGQ